MENEIISIQLGSGKQGVAERMNIPVLGRFLSKDGNNSSVWLESKCPGTERNRRRTSHSKRELSFSEVVVEVSCQKPSVARF